MDKDGKAGDKLHELQERYYELKQSVKESDIGLLDTIAEAHRQKAEALKEVDREIFEQSDLYQRLHQNVLKWGKKELRSGLRI